MTDGMQVPSVLFYAAPIHIASVEDVVTLTKELRCTEATATFLLDVNRGGPGANMSTQRLHAIVKNESAYVVHRSGLQPTGTSIATDLESTVTSTSRLIEVPPFAELRAEWDTSFFASGNGNNILGDNGRLFLDDESITIPSITATDSTLAYYGAMFVQQGDVVRFPDEAYPIFQMHVDEGYVSDFLMTEEGGGVYLEYHQDQPHYHHIVDGGGHYLLAKWNDSRTYLHVTAFKIPNGQAVYTKKGAIHCDAFLTGNLLVGYMLSNQCSTVLWRTRANNMVKVILR